MPDQPLFTSADLASWLGSTVDGSRGVVVERVVWGWLRPILGATERPAEDAVPAELFSWALELGAIAHENPAGLSSKQFGDVAEAYGSERRDEILAAIRASDLGTAGGGKPRGRFPAALPYPDPAVGCTSRW